MWCAQGTTGRTSLPSAGVSSPCPASGEDVRASGKNAGVFGNPASRLSSSHK